MPAPAHPIRILIADDHALFREAVRHLLEQESDLLVIGEAAGGREALELAAKLKPDLLLLDLMMPRMSGLDVLRELQDMALGVRTIVLAAAIEKRHVVEAFRLGARGILLKAAGTRLLFKSVRAVMAGEYWIGQDGVAGLVDSIKGAPAAVNKQEGGGHYDLSQRELEIVAAVVEGCTNKDIAQKFSLSEQTIKHHLTKIFEKTRVSNRLELALVAIQRRLC
jgi:DNA-binding NarL/FixJ family response regulator